MPAKRWDYGSWARLGQPVVREFADTQQPTAAILVDICLQPDQRGVGEDLERQLDATLNLAAAVSEALSTHNHHILLLAVGGCVQRISEVPTCDPHKIVLRSLAVASVETPACLTDLRHQLNEAAVVPGEVYWLLNQWNSLHADLHDDLRTRGCHVRRIFIGEQTMSNVAHQPGDITASIVDIETGRVEI
jgi:hypothetical protein